MIILQTVLKVEENVILKIIEHGIFTV